jgi:hypothetical protein
MGCIGRIGCLIVVVILGVAAWFTRDRWMGLIRDRDEATVTATTSTWQPINDSSAQRGRRAVESLARSGGPVFVNLTAAELAGYAVEQLARELPSADSLEAMVDGDRLALRASVRLGELGGSSMLGPLAGMLGDRERMKLAGTLRVVRPGLGEFDVKEATIKDFKVPSGMIPKIMGRITRGRLPEGVSPSALPLTIPRHVGDVRVASGRVTLYKANQ